MRFTQEEKDSITKDYKDGLRICELGGKYKRNDSSIINMLKAEGVFVSSKNRWTHDEVLWLRNHYATATLEEVKRRFPERSISNIYSKASKMGVSRDSYHWDDEDERFLIDNYLRYDASVLAKMLGDRYTDVAIRCKANKLGMKKLDDHWTSDEDQIIREYYPKMLAKDFVSLLPGRTVNGVILRARKLGVTSYYYSQVMFSEEERKYIQEHWLKEADGQIAKVLNRTQRSVKDVRNRLGLHRISDGYTHYADFDKLFRGQIGEWKQRSMEHCNYQCIVTHSKNFQVHHLINFKSILNEAYNVMDEMGLLKSFKITDYSNEEIVRLIEVFKEIHSTYPLGICVRKDLHDLFHSIYGRIGNNELQWNEFVTNYKMGVYKQ